MSSNIIGNRNISKLKHQSKVMGQKCNRQLILLISGVAAASSLLTILACFLLRSNNAYDLPVRNLFETLAKLNIANMQSIGKLSDTQLSQLSQFCLISKNLLNCETNKEDIKRQVEYSDLILSEPKKREDALKIIENTKEGSFSNLNFVIKNPYSRVESSKDIIKTRADLAAALKTIYDFKIFDLLSKVNIALDKAIKN